MWLAVSRRSDQLPRLIVSNNLNSVIQRETVGVFPFPISAPDDPVNGDKLRKFQFDPTFARFVGNPTSAVAVLTIIDVLQFVQLGIGIDARGAGLGAGGREGDIRGRIPGDIEFSFVQTR